MSAAHSFAQRAIRALLICLLLPAWALAQGVEFQAPEDKDPAALDRAMLGLARQVMAAPERRTGTSANELIWVQTAAGWYAEALAIIDAGRPAGAQFTDPAMAPIELYVRAKARQPADFDATFQQLFVQAFEKLDDRAASVVAPWFMPPRIERLRDELYGLIDKHRSSERLALGDAVDLCRRYVLLRVYEAIGPLSTKLIDADRDRRYRIEDVLVETPQGATINAIVVRPKAAATKLPTMLEFTIYTFPDIAARGVAAASRGYAGVIGFTRGKRSSSDPVVPFEHEGEDARALIDWISRQSWSDGRVGMVGGSYDGFTQWAAVKRLHPALKTIVPCCPNNPADWQDMTAHGRDYARLNIPVLAIDGYFDDGQNDAVRRLQEHYRHRPKAEHYLVIGPYDHFGSRMPIEPQVVRGYTIDPVAQMDTPELVFQWFDYVFKGAAKPALLKDKINFQVMGANTWRHAPSVAAMSDESRRFYLTSNRLSPEKPASAASLEMTVNFADRTTVSANTYPVTVVTNDLNAAQGLVFKTDPFDAPVSINGQFSATLRFVTHKKDMDVALVLYEAMPDGQYFHLSYAVTRASYAKDMSKRSLLTPHEIQTLTFDKTLLVSRQLSKGSRLVLVLDINRSAFAQVSHGTGKDVSDESLADATEPLKIQWLTDSYITVPMSH